MITDWNGRDIPSAASKGGVIVFVDPLDNLISTNIHPWPTHEIIKKHDQKSRLSDFDDANRVLATKKLGYCCYLQSINSEDALTWSVFGTVSYHDVQTKIVWVNDLFKLLGLSNCSPSHPSIFLWRRFPHAETLVPGGSEIDFGIITDDTMKWSTNSGH